VGLFFGLAFFYIVGTPPFGPFFSELLMLQGMVHARNWLVLGIFLVLLMLVFRGMSRAVLGMLQSPQPLGTSTAWPQERFHIAHAVSLYALAVSVPIAIFLNLSFCSGRYALFLRGSDFRYELASAETFGSRGTV
jgi:hydrogenase-4 component F